jgi:protocatechuate 3,4-dioxygenase beta subunit
VRVIPVGQSTAATYTDLAGAYELYLNVGGGRKTHTLRYVRAGYHERHLSVQASDLRETDELRLDARMNPLAELAPVSGLVTDADGFPVGGVRVLLFSTDAGHRYQAVSDREGRFELSGVEIGWTYRLWARPREGYRRYTREGLTVSRGGLDLAIVLEPLGSVRLSGQMVDPEGRPVPRFSLWLRSAFAGAERESLVSGDLEGYFSVEDLPEGDVSFQTRSAPFLAVSGIRLSGPATENVRLKLDVGDRVVDGHVVDSRGLPLAGSRVSLSWSDSDGGVQSRSTRTTATDARGYFLFTQIGPGVHSLAVDAPGFRSARTQHDSSADGAEILVRLEEVAP